MTLLTATLTLLDVGTILAFAVIVLVRIGAPDSSRRAGFRLGLLWPVLFVMLAVVRACHLAAMYTTVGYLEPVAIAGLMGVASGVAWIMASTALADRSRA